MLFSPKPYHEWDSVRQHLTHTLIRYKKAEAFTVLLHRNSFWRKACSNVQYFLDCILWVTVMLRSEQPPCFQRTLHVTLIVTASVLASLSVPATEMQPHSTDATTMLQSKDGRVKTTCLEYCSKCHYTRDFFHHALIYLNAVWQTLCIWDISSCFWQFVHRARSAISAETAWSSARANLSGQNRFSHCHEGLMSLPW